MPDVQIPQRTDQGYARWIFDNGIDCGEFSMVEIGGLTAESLKARARYGLPSREIGGPSETEGVTLERDYVATVDGPLYRQIKPMNGWGRGKLIILRQDAEGRVIDEADGGTGVMLVCRPPGIDPSGGETAKLHIEIGMDGE